MSLAMLKQHKLIAINTTCYGIVNMIKTCQMLCCKIIRQMTEVLVSNKGSHPFWPTVLSVEPMVHCVICLSVCRLSVRRLSICNVLYCGEMVRPSKNFLKE